MAKMGFSVACQMLTRGKLHLHAVNIMSAVFKVHREAEQPCREQNTGGLWEVYTVRNIPVIGRVELVSWFAPIKIL